MPNHDPYTPSGHLGWPDERQSRWTKKCQSGSHITGGRLMTKGRSLSLTWREREYQECLSIQG